MIKFDVAVAIVKTAKFANFPLLNGHNSFDQNKTQVTDFAKCSGSCGKLYYCFGHSTNIRLSGGELRIWTSSVDIIYGRVISKIAGG